MIARFFCLEASEFNVEFREIGKRYPPYMALGGGHPY